MLLFSSPALNPTWRSMITGQGYIQLNPSKHGEKAMVILSCWLCIRSVLQKKTPFCICTNQLLCTSPSNSANTHHHSYNQDQKKKFVLPYCSLLLFLFFIVVFIVASFRFAYHNQCGSARMHALTIFLTKRIRENMQYFTFHNNHTWEIVMYAISVKVIPKWQNFLCLHIPR